MINKLKIGFFVFIQAIATVIILTWLSREFTPHKFYFLKDYGGFYILISILAVNIFLSKKVFKYKSSIIFGLVFWTIGIWAGSFSYEPDISLNYLPLPVKLIYGTFGYLLFIGIYSPMAFLITFFLCFIGSFVVGWIFGIVYDKFSYKKIILLILIFFLGIFVFFGINDEIAFRYNCSWLLNQELMSDCYYNQAINTQNISLCEKIYNNDSYLEREDKNECYYSIAVDLGDVSICKYLTNEEDSLVSYQDACEMQFKK